MSLYGGQAANAFVKGMQSGYGVVDQALTNKQNRDTAQFKQDRAEEIYALAKQKEQQLQSQPNATAVNAETQQKIAQVEQVNKEEVASKVSIGIGEAIGASDPAENKDAIHNMNAVVQNNSNVAKTLAIPKGQQIEQLDLKLPKDDRELTKQLAFEGFTPEYLGLNLDDPEDIAAWTDAKLAMDPLMSVVKVGDNYVNLENMAVGIGADKRVPAGQAKKIKDTKTKRATLVKKVRTEQADKNVAKAKAKADKAGIYFDPSLLETVEEKNEAVEQVNKRVQQSVFQDPMAGTDTKQTDYKGGKEGMPKTQALVNGELVDVGEDGVIVDPKGKPVVTENADGSKSVQKKGPENGTTETITTKPDGTTESVVTKDQDLNKPSTSKATQNEADVEAGVQRIASEETEPSEYYMKTLYALAGITYPHKDDRTTLAKNFDFLKAHSTMTDEQIIDRLKPLTNVASTDLIKTMKELKKYKPGTPEHNALLAQIDKLNQQKQVKTEYPDAEKAEVARYNAELNSIGKDPIKREEAYKKHLAKLKEITEATNTTQAKLPDAKVQQLNDLLAKNMPIEEALDIVYGSDKNITADQIIENWKKAKGNYTNEELLEFSAAVRGKYKPESKDTEGTNVQSARRKFINRHKLEDKNTIVTDAMIDEAYELGLVSSKDRRAFKKEMDNLNGLSSSVQKLQKFETMIKDEKFHKDAIADTKNYLERKFPNKVWSSMTEAERADALHKIATNTYGGQILADYMKSISGTAIADAEYQRLLNIFQADKYANKESYIEAVRSFTNGLKDTLLNGSISMMQDTPAAALRVRKVSQELDNTRAKSDEPKVGQVVTLPDGSNGKVTEIRHSKGVPYMAVNGKLYKVGG